jgi:hypothetical protein
MKPGLAPQPLHGKAVIDEQGRVRIGSLGDTLLAIVKDADVARKARAVAIEDARARDIAFRIAMRRQKREDFALNARQRHDRPLRFAPPKNAISCRLPAADSQRPPAPGRRWDARSASGSKAPPRRTL